MTPFDWADYLAVADELAARTDDPAAMRTAIGRAYYAVFGTARRYLIAKGATIPQVGTAHAVVWHTLHATGGRTERRIANFGRQLLLRRRYADYDERFPNLRTEAGKAVTWAYRALTDLATLP